MNLEQAEEYLLDLELFGMRFGLERMRRLLSLVQSGRFDPTPLLTHTFTLDKIAEGYRLFGERLDGVLKVAIRPSEG